MNANFHLYSDQEHTSYNRKRRTLKECIEKRSGDEKIFMVAGSAISYKDKVPDFIDTKYSGFGRYLTPDEIATAEAIYSRSA